MQNEFNEDKFYECFMNALGVKRDDLSMEKKLIDDLGMDSMDFLDLIFQLERAWNIEIPRGEIENHIRAEFDETSFDKDGYMKAETLARIKQVFPEADLEYFNYQLRSDDIPRLFTVMTFAGIVKKALAQKQQSESY